jgi:hypothetical protein
MEVFAKMRPDLIFERPIANEGSVSDDGFGAATIALNADGL